MRIIGERECDGVEIADILIILTPQGRGTHIELGMAIALGKRYTFIIKTIHILSVMIIHVRFIGCHK